MQPVPATTLERPQLPPTRHGLLPDARHLVLPDGIVSTGMPAVRQTCLSIGIGFDPWQVDAGTAILAKDAHGFYAADTVVCSIPRQVGKTFLIGGLVFADCIVNPGTTTVWTAHRFKVARETFNELRNVALGPAMAPHVDPDAITTAAGNESITFRNGSRIIFAARERGAVRGFSKVRRLILDEAQILTESAMSDLAPTMNQAKNPQMILMGTPPKPTDPGETFTNLRSEALAGSSEGVVYIEFSAERGADLDDRAAWRAANPSLHSRTPEKAIVRLRKLLSNDDDFRREALGIWDQGAGASAFDTSVWSSLQDPDAPRGPAPQFAVSTAPDRSWSAVAVAWTRPDGSMQVQVTDYRPHATWVEPRVAELRAKWGGRVAADTAARGLIEGADEPSEQDQAQAHNGFSDRVTAGTLHHGNQAELNVAVSGSRWRTFGNTRVLDRKGSTDISPLSAAALAVHAAQNQGPPPPPPSLIRAASASQTGHLASAGF